MNNISVIFFDLYNTLIYTPVNTNPYKKLFKACGITSKKQIEKAKRIIITEDLPNFSSVINRLKVVPKINMNNIEADMNREISNIKMFPGTIDVLKKLRQKYKLGIISNLATPYTAPIVKFKLYKIMSIIILSCEEGYAKPEKEIYLSACKKTGVKPRNALMVGDSLRNDYQGAKKAKLNALLLNRENKPISVPNIKKISELPELLK